jgi:hypothetical protein
MKKTAIIAGAFLLIFSASVNAQEPTQPTQPAQPTEPAKTEAPATTKTYNDRWNNWDKNKYAMQPMPEALTTEKIFPALGSYQLTDKDGATLPVTITMDANSKGIIWVEGLPQGKFKAYLMKSPATYKIVQQKLGDDPEAKDAKSLSEGVLIYDKDANLMNVCIGCKYNTEDPGTAFLPAEEQPVEQPVATKTKTKNGKVTKSKTKVVKVKPVMYSGTKQVVETTTTAPATAPVTEPQH